MPSLLVSILVSMIEKSFNTSAYSAFSFSYLRIVTVSKSLNIFVIFCSKCLIESNFFWRLRMSLATLLSLSDSADELSYARISLIFLSRPSNLSELAAFLFEEQLSRKFRSIYSNPILRSYSNLIILSVWTLIADAFLIQSPSSSHSL